MSTLVRQHTKTVAERCSAREAGARATTNGQWARRAQHKPSLRNAPRALHQPRYAQRETQLRGYSPHIRSLARSRPSFLPVALPRYVCPAVRRAARAHIPSRKPFVRTLCALTCAACRACTMPRLRYYRMAAQAHTHTTVTLMFSWAESKLCLSFGILRESAS